MIVMSDLPRFQVSFQDQEIAAHVLVFYYYRQISDIEGAELRRLEGKEVEFFEPDTDVDDTPCEIVQKGIIFYNHAIQKWCAKLIGSIVL
jgi:hypothetical protein